MNKFVASVIISSVLMALSGCGQKTEASPSSNQTAGVSSFPWDCSVKEDGIGETYGCQTFGTDANKTQFILTMMCTSDLESHYSITGIKDVDMSSIVWSTQDPTFKIRLDDGPITDWGMGTIGNGTGLVFLAKSGNLNQATWNFLSEIAGAKKFGIKGYDEDGNIQSTSFPVAVSVKIAAKFSAMGCSGLK